MQPLLWLIINKIKFMKNKVSIIGNGGREDSLRWKLQQEGVEIEPTVEHYLTVIGPEAPIAEGLTDELESKLIPVFGPSKLAGRLETSKLWAKQFMQRNDIPTSHWITYTRDDIEEVILNTHSYPFVIKEDGLCGGKGVTFCETQTESIEAAESYASNKFNSASNKILIEDFIHGEEVSCFVLTDGKDYKVLPYCQDHKRVGEGDIGPNTGGMGAYAPAFGMLGTVLGLIVMMNNFATGGGEEASASYDVAEKFAALLSGMGLALITTFYGVFMSNMIFIPIGGKLKRKSENEMMLKNIVIEGIISIHAREHPMLIKEKLMTFVPSSQRSAKE